MNDDLIQRYTKLSQFLGLAVGDLETEFMRTPRILQEAAELAAFADRVREVAKYNVGVAEANAAARIREVPVNGKEPSQARIDSMVPLDEEVQAARQALIAATYDADMCNKLHKSFDSQTWLLRKVSDLHSTGYFQPQHPAVVEQRRKELREATAERNREEFRRGNVARPVR